MKESLRLCFLLSCLTFNAGALASDMASLARAVDSRLSYMKDVAGFKAQHHLPVEDLTQEHRVLASAEAAAEHVGLDPQSVRAFVVAQMQAAKAIQYRYRADWLAQPPVDWQPRSLEFVRQQLAERNDEILAAVAQRLQYRPIDERERAEFLQFIQQANLSDADKEHLFDALLGMRAATAEPKR